MEDLMEVLVGLYFVEGDTFAECIAYNEEFKLLQTVMFDARFKQDFYEAIQWIDPNLFVID